MAQTVTVVTRADDLDSHRRRGADPAAWARWLVERRNLPVLRAEYRLTIRPAGRRSLDGGVPSEWRVSADGSRAVRTTGGLPAWLGTTAVARERR